MSFQPGPSSANSSNSSFQYGNSHFGDTTYTKVFVGGLAWETQSETMRRYFEHFGEILEAVVIVDKHTGRSKGYGFVTFREPEAAWRACVDPTPVIDGRRANCNLASLGRPRLPFPAYGRLRPSSPFVGTMPPARAPYVRSFGYQQPLYGYQPGLVYQPYGFSPYSGDYMYPQGYNLYAGHQYYHIYGVPGTANTTVYPPVPGTPAYNPVPGYALPGHQMVQYSASATSPINTIPPPQFVLPSPQFMQGSASDG